MKLIFGADLVPTSSTEQLFIDGDTKQLFGDIESLIKSADRTFVNLECALTTSENRIKKFGPNLKADPKCVNAMKKVGITDYALSNNHVFDFGCEGLRDTMKALEDAGLPYFGVGENDTDSRKPYFFEQDGKRIAVINVCEHEYTYATPNRMGANPFDPFLTMQDIRAAKAEADFLIALYHGGKEYSRYPSPRLRNLCREMVLCGADVVLTQHSHCIGCYEEFEGGHILYGEGNFNFVYPEHSCPECWYTSLLVELNIDEDVKIKFHPIVATATGCDLARGEKAATIMSEFNERNEELKNGKWQDGWHAFCMEPERQCYYDALNGFVNGSEKDIQFFAHYLDCEAHTDVWRELFPTWNATNEIGK